MALEIRVDDPSEAFSWPKAYWAGAVAALAYAPSDDWAATLRTVYGAERVVLIRPDGDFDPGICIVEYPELAFIGVEGTANVGTQVRSYTLDNEYMPALGSGFVFVRDFYLAADYAALMVRSRVPKTKRLVLSGHSRGGAAASICSYILRQEGYTISSVYTLGSPRPGNLAFQFGYTLPNFRLTSSGDFIPSLPPEEWYLGNRTEGFQPYTQTMYHVGTEINVTGTDPGEVVRDTYREIKNFGLFNLFGNIFKHALGSYMEGVYSNLTPERQADFRPMASILIPLGSQGEPDHPVPGENLTPPPSLVTEAYANERSTLRGLVGPAGPLRVRLFTAPATVPGDLEGVSFTDPVFPGYGPRPLPSDLTISSAGRNYSRTGWVRVPFEPTRAPEVPQVIRGAYVTAEGDGGEVKPAFAFNFKKPRTVATASDVIGIRLRLDCVQASR
jgi:hypothetical protein